MVERDLTARGVSDPAVLAAVGQVPRHRFATDQDLDSAYADRPLPIGCSQTISQPYMVALMAELLRLRPGDRVLDVGTGSGYAAAVLSTIAGEVWSIERHPTLATEAAARLEELGYDQVHVVTGDGTRGWPDAAPFDAIAVAASAPDVPVALTDQLADGGRMVLPVDHPDDGQDLVVVERRGHDLIRRDVLAVRFVPLVSDDGTPPADE